MKRTLLSVLLVFLMPMDSIEALTIELSMEENSVDDMYDSCEDKMKDIVKDYLNVEFKDEQFKNAWKYSEDPAAERFNTIPNNKLTMDQIRALHLYTSSYYVLINPAIRTDKDKYLNKEFKYYSLHYLITSAIQTLKAQDKTQCHIVYRRGDDQYIGKVGQEMRFGYFTSTSNNNNIKEFGIETCFRIKTCFGSFIQEYSVFKDEEEILIPPYEKFKIIKIETGSTTTEEGLTNCKTIFVLESKGKLSKLNCKAPALSERQEPRK